MAMASTAILVKARAKFGQCLTAKHYDELLACSNIPEIANYLKANTHYGVSLENIKEAAVHRGNLEKLLQGKMFLDIAQLCKFDRSVGDHYFEYMVMKGEVDEILNFLRYFVAGVPEKYLFDLPDFFNRSTQMDLYALTQAKSYDDVLQVLKRTPYAKLLMPFRPESGTQLDFAAIEATLYRYLSRRAQQLIRLYFKRNDGKELSELFGLQAELSNIRKIYRAKKYYHWSPDMIRSQINAERCYFNKHQLDALIDCESADDVLSLLKTTRYRYSMEDIDFSSIDELTSHIAYRYMRRKIRFSREPAVVMAAAIALFEFEIENITNIIEGNRYGVASEQIKRLMILK